MEDMTNDSMNDQVRVAFLSDLKIFLDLDYLICLRLVIKYEESFPQQKSDVFLDNTSLMNQENAPEIITSSPSIENTS